MKVKEAVTNLSTVPKDSLDQTRVERKHNLYQDICKLYREEAHSRIELRSHGNKPSRTLIDSIIKEMDLWISKVCLELHIDVPSLGVDRAGIYAQYKLVEPTAEKQMNYLRSAYMLGQAPIEVLTADGLKAISNMMLGKITEEVRQLLPDKEKDA